MNRRLGRYELLHRLGRGGGGEVWEALLHGPAGFRRRVAVKLLAPGAGASAADDLVHEARLGALVAHPNVVSTLELGQDHGRYFLVMDLVRGCAAHHLHRDGPLPPAALLDIGVQVCEGLSHIHGLCDDDGWPLGLVHRDIKPGNLLIDTTHRVRIVDLGIARLQGTAELPSGTPGYVAPEQLRGEEGPTADVFSLGLTLTRLATRRRPFGRGAEALTNVAGPDADAMVTDPELLGALDEVLPGLGAVLVRAMRADPADRWPTAAAFAEALRSLYATCPTSRRLAALPVPSGEGAAPEAGGWTTERGRFVGREAELRALDQLLDGSPRWVMVVGASGVGKTRLVDEAVRGRTAVRIDASRVRTLDGLCLLAAEALSIPLGPDPVATVAQALRRVELLVIDEIERVLAPAAEAVAAWREAVPGLMVLCSSRVAPDHPGATLVRVGPLPLADAKRLFHLRLGAHVPDDVVTPLLRALDRLPLAVELAAARAKRTSPAAVLAQLQRTSSARLPGVREALEASWALLPSVDRQALVRLAAWEGSFDVRDAAAVLPPDGDPMARLESLVAHSLLHVRGNRFRLLTGVRAHARERLATERLQGEQRHGLWLARLGDERTLGRAMASAAVARQHQRVLADLVVASARAVRRGHGEVAAATALAAAVALDRAGLVQKMLDVLDPALGLGAQVMRLQHARAHVLNRLGRRDDALVAVRAALELAEGADRWELVCVEAQGRVLSGDAQGVEAAEEAVRQLALAGTSRKLLACRLGLGAIYQWLGRLGEAQEQLTLALRGGERLGFDLGHPAAMLATLRFRRGQVLGAQVDLRRALLELTSAGDESLLVRWTITLGANLLAAGEAAEARRVVEAVLPRARATGQPYLEAFALRTLVDVAMLDGRVADAHQLALQACDIADGMGPGTTLSGAQICLARTMLAHGQEVEGLRLLTQALGHRQPSRLVTAGGLSVAARYAPVPSARSRLDRFAAELVDEDTILHVVVHLARARLENRAGRAKEARGALLLAGQRLGQTDLPSGAPLQQELAELRAEIVA